LVCDISNIRLPAEYQALCTKRKAGNEEPLTKDWAFCRWLTKDIGVAAIPCSAFYTPERKELASNLIRLCFCKVDPSLEEARTRLLKLKEYIII